MSEVSSIGRLNIQASQYEELRAVALALEAELERLEPLKKAALFLEATERGDDLKAHEEAEADIWAAGIAYARSPHDPILPPRPLRVGDWVVNDKFPEEGPGEILSIEGDRAKMTATREGPGHIETAIEHYYRLRIVDPPRARAPSAFVYCKHCVERYARFKDGNPEAVKPDPVWERLEDIAYKVEKIGEGIPREGLSCSVCRESLKECEAKGECPAVAVRARLQP
jgi:hypothetical protein